MLLLISVLVSEHCCHGHTTERLGYGRQEEERLFSDWLECVQISDTITFSEEHLMYSKWVSSCFSEVHQSWHAVNEVMSFVCSMWCFKMPRLPSCYSPLTTCIRVLWCKSAYPTLELTCSSLTTVVTYLSISDDGQCETWDAWTAEYSFYELINVRF